MPKSHKTTKKVQRKIPPVHTDHGLPPQLIAMCAMLHSTPQEMAEALDATRKSLTTFAYDESLSFWDYVQNYIAESPYGECVEKALNADPGNMAGELYCAYAQPSILAGVCLSWLMFAERSR